MESEKEHIQFFRIFISYENTSDALHKYILSATISDQFGPFIFWRLCWKMAPICGLPGATKVESRLDWGRVQRQNSDEWVGLDDL